jgi:hypothetical protein
MSLAETNLFILDTRRTAYKKIMEADLIKEKFSIPAMNFVLNRSLYNPSVLLELKEIFGLIYKKIKSI